MIKLLRKRVDPLVYCWSLFDGCACGFEKGHECLHQCPDERHPEEWTDEQAAAWTAALRARSYPQGDPNHGGEKL